jgi:hypothetical protein
MRKVNVTYQVYSFDELAKTVQDKVINDEIEAWREIYQDEKDMPEGMMKAIQDADRMQTPWFTGSYIWDYCKDEVLACCKEYDYLASGEVFNPEFDGGKVQDENMQLIRYYHPGCGTMEFNEP